MSPIYESAGTYHAELENQFAVLSDHKSVVGVDAEDQSLLVVEDVTDELSFKCIGSHSEKITTVVANMDQDCLLVGEHGGIAVQYQLANGAWEVEKHYGNVKIGNIMSSTALGNLAVLGGNKNRIRLVDLGAREFVDTPQETAIELIYSPRLCLVARSVILTVGGLTPNYSKNRSDLFDVTNAYDKFNLLDVIERYPGSAEVGKLLADEKSPLANGADKSGANCFNQQLSGYKDKIKQQKKEFEKQMGKKNKEIDKLKVTAETALIKRKTGKRKRRE